MRFFTHCLITPIHSEEIHKSRDDIFRHVYNIAFRHRRRTFPTTSNFNSELFKNSREDYGHILRCFPHSAKNRTFAKSHRFNTKRESNLKEPELKGRKKRVTQPINVDGYSRANSSAYQLQNAIVLPSQQLEFSQESRSL